jgi:predicted nucleotidyltransferase
MSDMSLQIEIDKAGLADFCRRWKVAEFALFGSVLTDQFGPQSDVDVLITFAPDAEWGIFDLVDMSTELESAFGRRVDLVDSRGLRNPFRRHSIQSSKRVVHAA